MLRATSLLVVLCGRATKLSDAYMADIKAYSGTLRLGEHTPSYDAESEVMERSAWEHITDAQLSAAAARFVGDIPQARARAPEQRA